MLVCKEHPRKPSSPLQELEGGGVRADKKSKMGLSVGPVQQHRTGRGSCNPTAHPHPGLSSGRVSQRALPSTTKKEALRGRAWRMLASRFGILASNGRLKSGEDPAWRGVMVWHLHPALRKTPARPVNSAYANIGAFPRAHRPAPQCMFPNDLRLFTCLSF